MRRRQCEYASGRRAHGRVVECRGDPGIAADQIGGDAACIEKDVVPQIAEGLPVAPVLPLSGDVGPALFVRVYRFF